MKLKVGIALGGFAALFLGLVAIIIAQSEYKVLGGAGMILFLCGYALVGGTIIFHLVQQLRRKSVRPYEYAVLCTGLVLGLLIWLLSPALAGNSEPWDAPEYYLLAMLISGFVCGVLARRCWFFSAVAITLGQFPAANWGISMFFPISLISLLAGGIPSLAGAAIGSGIAKIAHRKSRNTQPGVGAHG